MLTSTAANLRRYKFLTLGLWSKKLYGVALSFAQIRKIELKIHRKKMQTKVDFFQPKIEEMSFINH